MKYLTVFSLNWTIILDFVNDYRRGIAKVWIVSSQIETKMVCLKPNCVVVVLSHWFVATWTGLAADMAWFMVEVESIHSLKEEIANNQKAIKAKNVNWLCCQFDWNVVFLSIMQLDLGVTFYYLGKG